MIRIAIYDKDVDLAFQLEEKLRMYGQEKGLKFKIEVLFSGEVFFDEAAEKRFYDIVYLGVGPLNPENLLIGPKLKAEAIKENHETLFIYMSPRDYAIQEIVESQPFRLMIKPFTQEYFHKYLEQAILHIQGGIRYFVYSSRHEIFRVPVKKILYFESSQRKAILHTENGTESFYRKLSDIEKEVNQGAYFLRIHQSYLVNVNAIVHYSQSQIQLSNGEILPVSSDRQKEVRRRYDWIMGAHCLP